MCLLRRPLAGSWRSLFTCYMTAAVGARRTSSSIWLSLLVFSRSRFASVFLDTSRLCRHSVFVSAGALFSSLPALRVSSLPALCSLCFLLWSVLVFLLLWSLLCSRLFTALDSALSVLLLSHLCLDDASRSSCATSTVHKLNHAQ